MYLSMINSATVSLSAVLQDMVNSPYDMIVRDPQAFQRTLLQGLGHAKAFGCGLMLVKPILER